MLRRITGFAFCGMFFLVSGFLILGGVAGTVVYFTLPFLALFLLVGALVLLRPHR